MSMANQLHLGGRQRVPKIGRVEDDIIIAEGMIFVELHGDFVSS